MIEFATAVSLAAVATAIASLALTMWRDRRTVKHDDLAQLEQLKAQARAGYIDETQAQISALKAQAGLADRHFHECENSLLAANVRIESLHERIADLERQNFDLLAAVVRSGVAVHLQPKHPR
jgi:septal ring factor EnvC (AmiA/AmiB activator)